MTYQRYYKGGILAVIAFVVGFVVVWGFRSLHDGDNNVYSYSQVDAEMESAKQRAVNNFEYFKRNWRSKDVAECMVKIAIATPGGDVEHVWFYPIDISDNAIKATCANVPVQIPDLRMGDVKELRINQLSDWMLCVGDKCYGGYTMRVMAKREPLLLHRYNFMDLNTAQQVDSAEASTIAVPPSEPSGSPR
jgi:uncharacterized protein YegJ (DUF2314 family)